MALTDHDVVLLRFAAEHQFVVAAQVARLLGTGQATARARLAKLNAAGHLRSDPGLTSRATAYQIRPPGLRAIESDLPAPPEVKQSTYRHDLGLGWLMLDAVQGRFGPLREVISERRMRTHDGRTPDDGTLFGGTRFGVWLGAVGRGGRDRRHRPDLMVVDAAGRRIAFELELSGKARVRREAILEGYAADRRIDGVVYLVDHQDLRRTIEQEARRVGAQDLVRVRLVTFPGMDGRAPDHARSAPHRTRLSAGVPVSGQAGIEPGGLQEGGRTR